MFQYPTGSFNRARRPSSSANTFTPSAHAMNPPSSPASRSAYRSRDANSPTHRNARYTSIRLKKSHDRSGASDQRIDAPLQTANAEKSPTHQSPVRVSTGRGSAPISDAPSKHAAATTTAAPTQKNRPSPATSAAASRMPSAARITLPPLRTRPKLPRAYKTLTRVLLEAHSGRG